MKKLSSLEMCDCTGGLAKVVAVSGLKVKIVELPPVTKAKAVRGAFKF